MNKKLLIPVFLCFFVFLLNFECDAKQQELKFVPEATIVLLEGKTLEVSDFAFYSSHYKPKFGQKGFYGSDIKGLIISVGDYWEIIQFSQILKLEITKGKNFLWRVADITFNSGETKTGEIPISPTYTWRQGDKFLLKGKAIILGTEGNFSLNLNGLKSLERSSEKPNRFIIMDNLGNTTTVSKLRISWSGHDLFTNVDSYKYKSNSFIYFNVANTEVKLKIQDIDSMIFEKKLIKIKMKNGDEAEGKFPRIERAYGKLSSGQIFFKYIFTTIHSIQFK